MVTVATTSPEKYSIYHMETKLYEIFQQLGNKLWKVNDKLKNDMFAVVQTIALKIRTMKTNTF